MSECRQHPCEAMTGRKRDICFGNAYGMPHSKRRAYIARWLADGTLSADPRNRENGNVRQPQQDHREFHRRERKYEYDPNRSCTHLRESLGTVHCKPCQSRTGKPADIPAFACALHGKCTVERTGLPIRGCGTCRDYEPEEADATPQG